MYIFFEITRNEFWRGNCAYNIFIYLGNSDDNAREKSDLSVKEIGILLVNLIYKKKTCIKGKNKKKVYLLIFLKSRMSDPKWHVNFSWKKKCFFFSRFLLNKKVFSILSVWVNHELLRKKKNANFAPFITKV